MDLFKPKHSPGKTALLQLFLSLLAVGYWGMGFWWTMGALVIVWTLYVAGGVGAVIVWAIVSAIHCWMWATWRNEQDERQFKEFHRKAQEQARQRREYAQKKSEALAKGLIEYKGEFLTPAQHRRQLAIEEFKEQVHASNSFKGCYAFCSACHFIWKIKKDYGLPARCSKCGGDRIRVDYEKSYGGGNRTSF